MPDSIDDPMHRIARLQEVLDQQAKDLIHLNGFLEKRESFIREGMGVFASFHQRALDQQDQERNRFEHELATRNAAITSLTDAVAQRDLAVTRLDGERAGRDVEIARLHAEIGRLHSEIGRLHSEIAHRDTIRTVQAETVARLQAHQVQLEALLHAKSNPLRSRTIGRCHRVILFGLRAVDSAWIGLVRIFRQGTTPR